MPLRESRPALPADPGERWAAAYDFVRRCHTWSIEEIARREADGRDTAEWRVYVKFTEHTLRELDSGKLDAWFGAVGVA